jgi:exosortase/archaeosortase family protein
VSAATVAGGGPGDRPDSGHRTRPAEASRGETIALGLMAAAAAAAISAIVLKEAMPVRIFEAWVSGRILPLATGISAGSTVGAPIVWFADGPHRYMGLLITADCTIDTLIVPFTAVTAWVAWHRVRLMRPLTGLAVAVGLLFAVNQLRLLLIVVLTVRYGLTDGFYWGHTLIGSLMTVFGVVLIFAIYALIALRRKSRPSPREAK